MGCGCLVAAPISYLPIKMIPSPTFGRISSNDANYTVIVSICVVRLTSRLLMFLPAAGGYQPN